MELDFSAQIRAANENKTLNKPFRTPSGPKKFSVYVKNDKGNVVKVNFGDPNMEIKRDDPERRKSFRARHQCDTNPGPKWKSRFWSCKMWSNKPVSALASIEDYSDEWDGETFWEESDLLKANPLLVGVEEITEEDEESC
jgi:hypothetical protein